ncbi:MAG: hypothetical protein LBC74_14785 [Planctomycetaceae bacterium]|jgi:hypothetical protein|nr:hypothetical protein [Planctomycetaceae bacterium]
MEQMIINVIGTLAFGGGGLELKGEYGKIIGSSIKFKASGKPKVGFAENGSNVEAGMLALSVYQANG